MRLPLLIALAGLLAVGAPVQAQVARQEIHALQSVTLSDADFLNGKRRYASHALRTTARKWARKTTSRGVASRLRWHGGSGSVIDEWSRELN
jgi:hypothetical protein